MRPTVYKCLSKRGSYSKSYTNLFLKESLRVSSHGLQMHCKIWICTISAEKKADFPADVTLLKCDFGSNLQLFLQLQFLQIRPHEDLLKSTKNNLVAFSITFIKTDMHSSGFMYFFCNLHYSISDPPDLDLKSYWI